MHCVDTVCTTCVQQPSVCLLVLQVIAEAVSLGHTLNRTVVPPPFLCWCEEDWVADILETCTIPGVLGAEPHALQRHVDCDVVALRC